MTRSIVRRVFRKPGLKMVSRSKRVTPRRAPRSGGKRKAGSRTKTYKKQKLNQGVHETRGGSESRVYIKHAPSRMGKFVGKMSKLAFFGNTNGILTNGAGLQSTSIPWTYFGAVDVAAMFTQALLQQYGSATPTGFRTERVLFKSVSAEVAYNNNTNDQARMVLLDIEPRTDIYNTAGDAIDPNLAWGNGLGHEIASGSLTQNQKVGAMPFASDMFCHFYNVKKITNVTLAPGQTHYHRIKFFPNKILTNEVISQGNVAMFKGLSLSHMAIIYGAPCLDNAAGVTTEATKVLFVNKFQYEFTFLPNNMTSITVGNNLVTTAGANIENMVTGASAAFAQV